ncbi:MauE/DoxX family redox-associated membrane protein [Demequina sp. NBRC 110054]|uniref:MauE/DoxX family redox-associated membrane protein n=1 Tax=Demequina sp. NBRC 110054 TaxID=1570343 RepID=UPI0009FD7611|nr:MauE/DoxX family redox-associated membrane protein [Demequina sp. NBRC 110054]
MTFRDRFTVAQPWISLLVRLGMAGILIAAAIPKLMDIPQSIRAVRAYQLLPEAIVPLFGTMLPIFELLLAAFLLAGLFTRWAAIAWLIMITGFMVGLIWAWAHGLSIDCGCFGGGGEVAEGTTNYPLHMLERTGFLILGFWLAFFPRTPFSLDRWMAGDPEPADA